MDGLVLASVRVTALADWNGSFGAISTLREHGFPYGLDDSLCTLRPPCSSDDSNSATDTTHDTGGWLDLTRQGLAPCKAHQASPGALMRERGGRTDNKGISEVTAHL